MKKKLNLPTRRRLRSKSDCWCHFRCRNLLLRCEYLFQSPLNRDLERASHSWVRCSPFNERQRSCHGLEEPTEKATGNLEETAEKRRTSGNVPRRRLDCQQQHQSRRVWRPWRRRRTGMGSAAGTQTCPVGSSGSTSGTAWTCAPRRRIPWTTEKEAAGRRDTREKCRPSRVFLSELAQT